MRMRIATKIPMITTHDLREQLLADLHNRELRQKYLATRTPEWIKADGRLAHERLLIIRLVRGLIGLTVVGAIGGAIGDTMGAGTASGTGPRALPLLVAI